MKFPSNLNYDEKKHSWDEPQVGWRARVGQVDNVLLFDALVWCDEMTVLMMTSSNGNIFRVTGPGEFPALRPVTLSFDIFFDLRLNKRLSKIPEAGDLRRYRAQYDVTVMSQ